MNSYLFVFGRTPQLSLLELTSFFPSVTTIGDSLVLVETDTSIDPVDFISKLGGSVKIAQVVSKSSGINPNMVSELLLEQSNKKNITFGVSSYTDELMIGREYLADIKERLIKLGLSVRFVEAKHGETLSSVVIQKQDVVELIIAGKTGEYIIGKTVAIQDFEEWGKRDFGRPFADPKSGMLPPKVARIAVNLAIRAIPASEPGSITNKKLDSRLRGNDIVILDPFCGMGTILGEALLSGCTVIGSDQKTDVVDKAQKNLEWLASMYRYMKSDAWNLFVSEATHVSEKVATESVDAIVTEPFLGNTELGDKRQATSDKQEKVKNAIKGLEKLYVGCLRDWYKVLKPNGKVVIALPEYSFKGRTYFVKKVIDNCEILGYTVIHGPIEYSRPQAVVRRKFYILQKVHSK